MKAFSIIIMIVGFLSVLIAGTFADFAVTRATIWGIFGSSLFGSGLISLAITQALGKKP